MINDKADEVIKKLFKSLLTRYQIGLDVPIKEHYFIFHQIEIETFIFYQIRR